MKRYAEEKPKKFKSNNSMWIFTMQQVAQGHQGYEIVVWNRSRFISIEMQ